jgi:hypothetical protein
VAGTDALGHQITELNDPDICYAYSPDQGKTG